MEQWEIRQPKLTHVLKNTDENLFQELAKDFSAIIGSPVKVSIVKEKERWMIFYNPSGEGLFRFYISLHDPSMKEYLTSDFELDRPVIQIHELFVHPIGQGLGTQLIFKLLDRIQDTKFELIVLRAESERAARFWIKFGFEYKEDTTPYMPSMSLDLVPIQRRTTPVVKIQFKQTSN